MVLGRQNWNFQSKFDQFAGSRRLYLPAAFDLRKVVRDLRHLILILDSA